MLGRSSGGAAGRMGPVPGVCAGAGCDVTGGIKRRAVLAAAEPLAGCSAPVCRTASTPGELRRVVQAASPRWVLLQPVEKLQ